MGDFGRGGEERKERPQRRKREAEDAGVSVSRAQGGGNEQEARERETTRPVTAGSGSPFASLFVSKAMGGSQGNEERLIMIQNVSLTRTTSEYIRIEGKIKIIQDFFKKKRILYENTVLFVKNTVSF